MQVLWHRTRGTNLDRCSPFRQQYLPDLHRDERREPHPSSAASTTGDVTTYLAEAGYHNRALTRALASVTSSNPFFLIEALRHVDESSGQSNASTLPQGVKEAVDRAVRCRGFRPGRTRPWRRPRS